MPRYEHDCDNCRYLGSLNTDEARLNPNAKVGDVYVCVSHKPKVNEIHSGSLLVRWSSEPSDYGSLDLYTIAHFYLNRKGV